MLPSPCTVFFLTLMLTIQESLRIFSIIYRYARQLGYDRPSGLFLDYPSQQRGDRMNDWTAYATRALRREDLMSQSTNYFRDPSSVEVPLHAARSIQDYMQRLRNIQQYDIEVDLQCSCSDLTGVQLSVQPTEESEQAVGSRQESSHALDAGSSECRSASLSEVCHRGPILISSDEDEQIPEVSLEQQTQLENKEKPEDAHKMKHPLPFSSKLQEDDSKHQTAPDFRDKATDQHLPEADIEPFHPVDDKLDSSQQSKGEPPTASMMANRLGADGQVFQDTALRGHGPREVTAGHFRNHENGQKIRPKKNDLEKVCSQMTQSRPESKESSTDSE